MPTVTGTLRDFNIQSLAAYSPRIIFTPSGVATSPTRIYATKPIIVTPNLGGDFEVFLQATEDMSPLVYYTIRIEWLDSDAGYQGVDLADWKLFVPSAGGAIGDLVGIPPNPALVWVAVTPPPTASKSVWWLQVNPDNPDDPDATGILWEWA